MLLSVDSLPPEDDQPHRDDGGSVRITFEQVAAATATEPARPSPTSLTPPAVPSRVLLSYPELRYSPPTSA